jgi:hypothetical protein
LIKIKGLPLKRAVAIRFPFRASLSKVLTGAPQYTLRIKDWNTDAIADANAFVFKPPADTAKASLSPENMKDFDELPPGTVAGAKK